MILKFRFFIRGKTAAYFGGATSIVGKKLTVKSSLFEHNAGVQYGLAIYAKNNCVIIVLNCLFQRNKATRSGGAIDSTGLKTVIEDSSFDKNNAFTGGAIRMYNLNGEIKGFSFSHNKAIYSGGAVYQFRQKFIIKTSQFQNHYAKGNQGQRGALCMQGLQFLNKSTSHYVIFHFAFNGNHASLHAEVQFFLLKFIVCVILATSFFKLLWWGLLIFQVSS